MILIDNNQLLIANIFVAMKHSDIEDENILRHLVVNTYRFYNRKFKEKYGDMIICHDSAHCWRNDLFEHYKANRKLSKKKSSHDWDKIFNTMTSLREEIKQNFPWKNISVPKTEADDIIACVVKNSSPDVEMLIISSDKDFQQLQNYSNVKQWSPIKNDFLICKDPEDYLLEHIIKGDSSDGIPNILSDDDTFVIADKRQKPCGKTRIDLYKTAHMNGEINDVDVQLNWKRNERLISFDKIPNEINENIVIEYNKDYKQDHEDLYDLRKTLKRPAKHKRIRDKKYLNDMLNGYIDKDDYHDYNGN